MSAERSSVLEAALDRISEAARESARRHVRHWVQYDEPTASSRRLQKTVCGSWVSPRDVALRPTDVTCADCVRVLDELSRLEI